MRKNKLFFDLLRIAVCRADGFDVVPTPEQWRQLFREAKRQALMGICASGIGRLDAGQRPPRELALRWAAFAVRIEERNRVVSRRAAEVSRLFAAEGLRSCVLKGQGMARLYAEPLRRQSGDIDIWVEGDDKRISSIVRKYCPMAKARYHHIDLDIFGDVSVEVHFRPSWMFSPFANRRLQRWFRSRHEWGRGLTEDGYCVPSVEFDAVFILVHIFRHLFDEGIGLRQLLDYYHVVRALPESGREMVVCELKSLGLFRFCGAVMYVLHKVLDMKADEMLVPVNRGMGVFLLDEIMQAGNFGHYDGRISIKPGESPLHIFLRKQRRALRLLRYFPGEVFWSPYFQIYQRLWRWRRGYL